MRNIPKLKRYLVLCMSLILMFCSTLVVNAAEQIKINHTKVSLNVGEETQLLVENTDKKPIWYSSNVNIADVDSTGKVIAVSKGNATITARIGAKKNNSKLTVNAPTI